MRTKYWVEAERTFDWGAGDSHTITEKWRTDNFIQAVSLFDSESDSGQWDLVTLYNTEIHETIAVWEIEEDEY